MNTARIHIDLTRQQLLFEREHERVTYCISTSRYGAGEVSGSECTPRGMHIVRARIGSGAPSGTVFVGRRSTGEICTPALYATAPDRDWILTRILWLSGIEPGRNRMGRACVVTFIYTGVPMPCHWTYRVRTAAFACAMSI